MCLDEVRFASQTVGPLHYSANRLVHKLTINSFFLVTTVIYNVVIMGNFSRQIV